MRELTIADRHGNRIGVGSKVHIVGRSSDSTRVYFAGEMKSFLNDGKTYTVHRIEGDHAVTLVETTWCWDTHNIAQIPLKSIPKPKPVLFEPTMLDI